VLRLLVARDHITQGQCDAALADGLVQAIIYCEVELAREMLEAGMSANGRTRMGKSLLAKVIRLSNEDYDDDNRDSEIDCYNDDDAFAIAKLLVDFGAQVDLQTAIEHASPLERAAQYGWEDMVRWLQKRGAKPVLRASILRRRHKQLISEAARRRCKAIVTEEYGGHVVYTSLEDLISDSSSDDEDDEDDEDDNDEEEEEEAQ
jgi:hypothetical protein